MEENNGRKQQGASTVEELTKENMELKQTAAQMYNEIVNLKGALTRADFMFRVLHTEGFSDESKKKATEWLEKFIFGDPESKEEVKKEK